MTHVLIAGPGCRHAEVLKRALSSDFGVLEHEDGRTLHASRLREKNLKAIVYLPGKGHGEAMRSEVSALRGVIDAAEEAGVERLLLMSCHRVYGASPKHSLFLPETQPLCEGDNGALRELVELDRTATAAVGKGKLKVIVLRPVYVSGGGFGGSLEGYLSARFVPSVFGFNPMVQLIHAFDLARAVGLALTTRDLEGPYNITGAGTVPLSVVAKERGIQRVPLVGGFGLTLNDWAYQAGLSTTANSALSYLKHVVSVDGSRFAKATGFAPVVPLRTTVLGEEASRFKHVRPSEVPKVSDWRSHAAAR